MNDERLVDWQAAVEAARKHIKLAGQLQHDGVEGIKRIRAGQGSVLSLKECHQSVGLGVRMERGAYQNLLYLHRVKPKAE